MARVKQGRLIRVDNTERLFGSSPSYQAVWVEDSDGGNERCLLFTDDEINKAEERAAKNVEDLTEKGFFTDILD